MRTNILINPTMEEEMTKPILMTALITLLVTSASAKRLEVINQVNVPVYLYFRCVDPIYTYTTVPAAKNNHPARHKMSVGEIFASCNKYEVIAYTKLVDKPDWTLTSGQCVDLHTDRNEQITVDAIGNKTLGNLKISCKTTSH
jgi:hypothetical protein